MNKAKIILPVASMFMLVGCGPKTKTVKDIWSNTWAYVNSSIVTYNINDIEKLKDGNINWDKTHISCNRGGYGEVKFEKADQKIENLTGSEFIRNSNYSIFKDNRDFFAKNRVVVSSKEEAKVKVGDAEYKDAKESTDGEFKTVEFNGNDSLKVVSYDSEGYIVDGVEANVGVHCNKFTYDITLTNSETVIGSAYLELVALA